MAGIVFVTVAAIYIIGKVAGCMLDLKIAAIQSERDQKIINRLSSSIDKAIDTASSKMPKSILLRTPIKTSKQF